MESPTQLRTLLRKQWENAGKREARLLSMPGAWPIELSIGRPSARELKENLDQVKRHVEAWKSVTAGHVECQSIRSRAISAEVLVPAHRNRTSSHL